MTPFTFKRFQKEDLARLALHPGGVLGWDPGLGKTIAMYVWGLLKIGLQDRSRTPSGCVPSGDSGRPKGSRLQPDGAILMVAPGDLHDQIASDGRELFRIVPTPLDSQATFLRLATVNPKHGGRQLPPGYYITSYTQLTGNGVAEFPRLNCIDPRATLRELGHDLAEVEEHFNRRAVLYQDEYEFLNVTANDPLATIEARYLLCQRANSDNEAFLKQLDEVYHTLRHFHTATRNPQFHQLAADQVHFIALQAARMKHAEYSQGIGEARRLPSSTLHAPSSVKCVYSPALVDLCQDCFVIVIADEATKIQGEETIIGTGTRQLNPLYRLVMTATPIKNRLPSVFRLAWWGTGGLPDAHARFPYPDAADAREDFANEFMVSERNLTKEESASRTGHHRRYSKLTPQVCNVHRLWKLFAPVILRRRKKDCGEDIVQKHRHVLRVPMGTFQAQVYKYHLNAKYTDHKGKPAIGAQLQALRVAAAEPSSASLIAKPQQHDRLLTLYRSPYSYTPKLAATLNLIKEIMERGEQVIIFHTFLDSIDVMSARLQEAGVSHLVMDGRTSPARRGKLAAQFKRGPVPGGIPVMLANSDCMAAGHSFSLCANGLHYSYQWALDLTLQSDDRYYRINSPKDVNSYRTVCNGSIDLRMEAQAEEKSDAAELVLDGQLMQKHVEELNHAELLRIAWRDFSNKDTIDERELMKSWPKLRSDLATAARQWGGGTGGGKRNETSNNEQRTLITEMGLTVIPFPQPRPLAPELADLPLFATR